MIYRGPGFVAIVRFGPLVPSVRSIGDRKNETERRLADGEVWGRSQIIRRPGLQ